jgi:hypothetical protein
MINYKLLMKKVVNTFSMLIYYSETQVLPEAPEELVSELAWRYDSFCNLFLYYIGQLSPSN